MCAKLRAATMMFATRHTESSPENSQTLMCDRPPDHTHRRLAVPHSFSHRSASTGWCPVVPFDICCVLQGQLGCAVTRIETQTCLTRCAGSSSQRKVRAETIAQRFSACRTPLTCQRVLPTGSSGPQAAVDIFDLDVSDDERVKL